MARRWPHALKRFEVVYADSEGPFGAITHYLGKKPYGKGDPWADVRTRVTVRDPNAPNMHAFFHGPSIHSLRRRGDKINVGLIGAIRRRLKKP